MVFYLHILLSRYIRELLLPEFKSSHVGCCIGGMLINVLAYADAIVLLAPKWRGLQHLLWLLKQEAQLSQRDRATLCVIEYFALVTQCTRKRVLVVRSFQAGHFFPRGISPLFTPKTPFYEPIMART